MKKIIIVIVLVGIAAAAWWLGAPLFTNETVNESLPVGFIDQDIQQAIIQEEITDTRTDMEILNQEEISLGNTAVLNSDINPEIITEPIFDDIIIGAGIEVAEPMMEMKPEMSIETRGSFSSSSNRYQGEGQVKIINDGPNTFLRFENFSVTNGPDLFVTLNTGKNADSEHVTVAALKGNKGDQNYNISEYNLDDFESVSIYCRAFSVEFAVAAL